MITNMTKERTHLISIDAANIFRILGQPARVRIILAIGTGEACVCHLEAALGLRQAYISQHLMALRQDGVVETRREQRNIYYHLVDAEILALIVQAARLVSQAESIFDYSKPTPILPDCPCPHCMEARGLAVFVPTSTIEQLPDLSDA
jgi:ArsR family transcriptional regulator